MTVCRTLVLVAHVLEAELRVEGVLAHGSLVQARQEAAGAQQGLEHCFVVLFSLF